MGGPFITDLVLVEEEDRVYAGKDACYIMCAGFLSASIEWRRCDISGQAVPEMRQIQTHSSHWDQAV